MKSPHRHPLIAHRQPPCADAVDRRSSSTAAAGMIQEQASPLSGLRSPLTSYRPPRQSPDGAHGRPVDLNEFEPIPKRLRSES